VKHLSCAALIIALTGCALRSAASQNVAQEVAAVAADGDIILHKSQSDQAAALRAATGSAYTHVGLLFTRDDELQVLEAVEPVRWTPLDDWIERGQDRHVVVLRAPALSPDQVSAVRARAEAYIGASYDLLFEWSDDRIYCSELVYKAFEGAELEIGATETFGDLALNSADVRRLIDARTDGGIDLTEPVVTPVSVLNDDDLVTVFTNDPNVSSC
jgi:hypothetical protein